MSVYVKSGATWYTPKLVWVKTAGNWVAASKQYTKNGGVWQQHYAYVPITTNQQDYNLYTAVGSPTTAVTVYCVVNAGVEITASLNTNFAFTVGSFPANSKVYLINNGYIVGKGGQGVGKGYISGARSVLTNNLTAPTEGNGGPALRANFPISIDNTSGVIGGGGGGGGSGGSQSGDCSCTTSCCPSGSVSIGVSGVGGGGAGYGPAGIGYVRWWGGSCGWIAFSGATRANSLLGSANVSSAGTLSAGGSANGSGGAGGTLGANGSSGTGSVICSVAGTGPGTGGTGGSATSGSANITWIATGTRYGTIG